MEFENILYNLEPNSYYIGDEYFQQQYSLEETFLENDDFLAEYLQVENDVVMDIDSIEGDDNVFGPEIELLNPTENDEEAGSGGQLLTTHDLIIRTIQEELMEETGLTDLLLMGAEAVESRNRELASAIVLRINALVSSREEDDDDNNNGPIDRLALFFSQGLILKSLEFGPDVMQKCISPVSPVFSPVSSPVLMSAFQMLQEISPYIKFAHFTANQAILEATLRQQGSERGGRGVHIVDFDILEGIQWPSLMSDLSVSSSTTLTITATVSDLDSWGRTQQTGKRLHEYASSINLHFEFDQILLTTEEDLFQVKKRNPDDLLIANCMVHQLHMPHRDSRTIRTFINGLKKLSPEMIVLVEDELFNVGRTPSFIEFFTEAIHHYTAVSDALVGGFCGGYRLAQRVIEKEFVGPRIVESLRQFSIGRGERGYSMKGFRTIPLSSCNVSQAKYLVSLFNGSYWVQNEQCRLALCWKSRPLTTASIWVPTTSSQHSPSSSTTSSFH